MPPFSANVDEIQGLYKRGQPFSQLYAMMLNTWTSFYFLLIFCNSRSVVGIISMMLCTLLLLSGTLIFCWNSSCSDFESWSTVLHFHRKSWIIKDYNSLISQFFLNFVVQSMLSLSLCSHATASILCQIIDKSYIRADLPFLKTSIICHSLWCILVVDYWRFLWIR